MKKSVYIMSSIEIIIGAIILSQCSIIKIVLPELGRVVYQAAAAGSYSPMLYKVSFPLATFFGVGLIAAGVVQMIISALKNKGR